MKIFLRYIRDRKKVLLAAILSFGIIGAMFFLYNISLGKILYISAIVLVIILLGFATPDFIQYRRKHLYIQALRDSITTTLDQPEYKGTLQEEGLVQICGDLCRQLRNFETVSATKQGDMLAYYTLWVHQIKTPLAAMRLILQSNPSAGNDAIAQELFKVERYVEMVLGYLRLDTISSDLRLEKLSVYQIVRQAVKKFAPQFIYKKLSVSLDEFDLQAITDEKWLLFVLEQLLSNALKYTSSGGVYISVENNNVLAIRDTGTGISPDDLPRIFERGFTGYNGRQDKTASGLGLYLCKKILDKLKTPIEITSLPGEGTTVRLYLHRDEMSHY